MYLVTRLSLVWFWCFLPIRSCLHSFGTFESIALVSTTTGRLYQHQPFRKAQRRFFKMLTFAITLLGFSAAAYAQACDPLTGKLSQTLKRAKLISSSSHLPCSTRSCNSYLHHRLHSADGPASQLDACKLRNRHLCTGLGRRIHICKAL